MVPLKNLKNKKILIFGAGLSGLSTIKKLKNKVKDLSFWDDNLKIRMQVKKNFNLKSDPRFFLKFFEKSMKKDEG